MINAQTVKERIVVLPQSIATTEVTGTVDTLGADYVVVKYYGDTAAAGDAITTLKLSHGDTTSSYTDITAAVGGGVGGFSIPAPNTSTGDVIKWCIERNNAQLKRYLKITIVGDATARLSMVSAELHRLKTLPDTDAEAGCTEIIYI